MKSKSAPKISPQERLLKEVVNQILAHPETWDQRCWHGHSSCNTTHCVAGWLQVKSGKPANDSTVRGGAKAALALTDHEANWLFAGERTLSDIYYFAKNFSCDGFNRAGFDRTGYNCYGFNRTGYDRAGYDRDGFDRDGFDRAGFNRDGFDRDGFDCAGFNRDGYDRAGYDCHGYDRDGFDRAGFNRDGFDRDGFNRDGFNRDGFNCAGSKLVLFEL